MRVIAAESFRPPNFLICLLNANRGFLLDKHLIESSNDYGKMGRKPWTTRLTAEDCLSLDICVFKTLFRQDRTVVGTYRWGGDAGPNTAVVAYAVIPKCPNGP